MTKQVGSYIRDLGGNPISNVPIEVELVLGQAWHTLSDVGYGQLYKTATDANGFWSVVLPENDILDPVGTAYRAVEKLPSQYGGSRVYLFQVLLTLSGGLNYVHDILMPELSPVGAINTYLTKSYADATYATLGTSGSAGPAGPVGPAGGTPLPNVYTTEVALLADTPTNGTMGYAVDTTRLWGRVGGAWKFLTGGNPVTLQSVALGPAGPSVGTTPLVLGSMVVAAVPYARVGLFTAAVTKGMTVATDTFSLDMTDGTNTRSAQMQGPMLGAFPWALPPMNVPIAANASPTITVTLTRIAGTGTTSTTGNPPANYDRLDAYYTGID